MAGATLTLTQQNGAYLVAFLALFVRLAGSHTWQILSYIFLQNRAIHTNTDTLTGQQLAVLRNVPSDLGVLLDVVKIGFRGRKAAWQPLRKSVWLLLTAAAHIIIFGVAGIFSSRVTGARSEVLLQPGTCGAWLDSDFSTSNGPQESAGREPTARRANTKTLLTKS